ncbi:hypothetical protein ES705_32507 [subsurface metagenome]
MVIQDKAGHLCRYRSGNAKKGYVCTYRGYCQYWNDGPFPCRENYQPIYKIPYHSQRDVK